MKGDSTSIHGEKAINLPFHCQEIPLMQHSIKTHYGELMLFLELQVTDWMVRDRQECFVCMMPHQSTQAKGSSQNASMTATHSTAICLCTGIRYYFYNMKASICHIHSFAYMCASHIFHSAASIMHHDCSIYHTSYMLQGLHDFLSCLQST